MLIPRGLSHKESMDKIEFDTSNLLFIAAGAFFGLDKIVMKKAKERGIGFNANVSGIKFSMTEFEKLFDKEDLIEYGFIPEFIGRFQEVVVLAEMNVEDLIRIMTEVKNNLVDQWKAMLAVEGKSFEIDKDALRLIAEKAYNSPFGARTLQDIFESYTKPIVIGLDKDPDSVIGYRITKETIKTGMAEKIIKKSCLGQCGDNCCQKTDGDCCDGDGHDDEPPFSASR